MGLFSQIASGILGNANAGGRISSDMGLIETLALKDETTCRARKTPDVLTDRESHAYITRVTSRSASQTRVFLGEPDEEAEELARAVARYLEAENAGLLFMDRQMGLHKKHRTLCRTVVTRPYARLLFMWDKLLFKPEKGGEHEPHQILIQVPEWGEASEKYLPEWHRKQKDAGSPLRRILVDAGAGVTFVLGSDYFGEIKKGHLRMAMYREKKLFKETGGREGGLGVHAGGKVIRAKDSKTGRIRDLGALFFGLSGTGKTSLSVHHFWLESGGERVIIRQDDFFVLDKDAKAYGTEDNAYIKTEGLEGSSQPLLYGGAMRKSAVLENAYVDPKTRRIDFFRYDHPFTTNKKCLNGRGIVARNELVDNGVSQADEKVDLDSADRVFFISRRGTVVPPVARLSLNQAAAFFMLGESIITSAADPVRAGQSVREVGTNPFIVGSEAEEGNIFYRICKANPKMQCFLLNTGSFGGRTVELASGTLAQKEFEESVERFSKGIDHPRAKKDITVKVNGKGMKFELRLVKLEAEYGNETIRDQKALGNLLERARNGEIDRKKVAVRESALLVAEKISLRDSCTIIREIARNSVKWEKDPLWGYEVAKEIPGLDLGRFDWRKYYSKEEHTRMIAELRKERAEWLARFPELAEEIRRAISDSP